MFIKFLKKTGFVKKKNERLNNKPPNKKKFSRTGFS